MAKLFDVTYIKSLALLSPAFAGLLPGQRLPKEPRPEGSGSQGFGEEPTGRTGTLLGRRADAADPHVSAGICYGAGRRSLLQRARDSPPRGL